MEIPDKSSSDVAVTLPEWLEEEKQLEEDAFAVLAASDEKNCTYLKGYNTRQAIYSCKTCRNSNDEPLAICLACSYACHEKHDLYELYTKRGFRCDCGNSKSKNNPCTLFPNKAKINEHNKYNQNFSGLYCTCSRPYPDSEIDEDMYQCISCEDWFHANHLESSVPDDNAFDEMICGPCMKRLHFLWYYYLEGSHAVKAKVIEPEVKKEKAEEDDNQIKTLPECPARESQNDVIIVPKSDSVPNSSDAATDSGIESSCDSVPANNSCECKLLKIKSLHEIQDCKGATFWYDGWRSSLCKCTSCQQLYVQFDCSFICDDEDTVKFYEKQGKEKNIQVSQYERGMSEINKLDRVKTIETFHAYNHMTGELKEYLRKFVENGKVVREEDIKEFFRELQSRKRPRFELYNC